MSGKGKGKGKEADKNHRDDVELGSVHANTSTQQIHAINNGAIDSTDSSPSKNNSPTPSDDDDDDIAAKQSYASAAWGYVKNEFQIMGKYIRREGVGFSALASGVANGLNYVISPFPVKMLGLLLYTNTVFLNVAQAFNLRGQSKQLTVKDIIELKEKAKWLKSYIDTRIKNNNISPDEHDKLNLLLTNCLDLIVASEKVGSSNSIKQVADGLYTAVFVVMFTIHMVYDQEYNTQQNNQQDSSSSHGAHGNDLSNMLQYIDIAMSTLGTLLCIWGFGRIALTNDRLLQATDLKGKIDGIEIRGLEEVEFKGVDRMMPAEGCEDLAKALSNETIIASGSNTTTAVTTVDIETTPVAVVKNPDIDPKIKQNANAEVNTMLQKRRNREVSQSYTPATTTSGSSRRQATNSSGAGSSRGQRSDSVVDFNAAVVSSYRKKTSNPPSSANNNNNNNVNSNDAGEKEFELTMQ
jgi:hypothetical protein